jgi:L-fucose isomerase-like protein
MLEERKLRKARVGFFKLVTHSTGELYRDPIAIKIMDELIGSLSKKDVEVFIAEDKFISTSESAVREAVTMLGKDIDAAVIFISSWIETINFVTLVKELKDLPILIWSFPPFEDKDKNLANTGSYAAAIASKGPIKRVGRQFESINSFPSKESLDNLYKFAVAARAKKLLQRSKLGMIGFFAIGLYNGTADELMLRWNIGPEIVPLYEAEFLDGMESADENRKKEFKELIRSKSIIENNVYDLHMEKMAKMYVSFEDLITKYNLDAIIIRCHSDFSGRLGMTGCIPYSILADRKIVVGCESDILLTTTMLTHYYLSNEVVTYGDLQYRDGDTIVFSPCGTWPCSLTKGKMLLRYLDPKEFLIEGILNAGEPIDRKRATLSRIMEKVGNYEMITGAGEVVSSGLTRGLFATIYFKPDGIDGIEKLESIATAHHFSLVYKDITKEIRFLDNMLNIPTLEY